VTTDRLRQFAQQYAKAWCSQEEVTSDELRQFAERYANAWCSQNAGAVVAFYAENASISVNDGPPAAIAEVARSFMRDFPDMIVAFDKLEPRGDWTAFHWTLTGTYTETGNSVRISGYELWKIDKDGLIAESQGHFDAADYERQIKKK
jgi:hypothetical protein